MELREVWAMLEFWFASRLNEVLPEANLRIAEHPQRRGVNGWCDCSIWPPIVAVTPEVADDPETVVATLTHEGVHVILHFGGHIDVVGQRHTTTFRDMAQKLGLIVEFDQAWGWGITSPSEALLEFCGVKALA